MVAPPLVPSPTTQSLPVELFPTLFSFCSPSTLAAWCSTSTSVLKLAGPVLYSTVVIREPEDYLLLFRESDAASSSSRIAPFLSLHQIKHLVLSTGFRQVHSSGLSFERITPSKGAGGEVSTLRIHSLTLTNPDTSDFSGLFSRLSPTHLVLCRPQGERSIFDHAIDVRAEDTILRHWDALESVTLRGANMLSLRPTRSGAFYSNSEFFLVPAATYPPPGNNHHHNNPNGNGWQHLFPPNANANGAQPNANNNQPNHAVGFHLNAHHHHTLHFNNNHNNNNHPNISHTSSRHVSSRRQPLNIIFDLRPQFLPPHLTIPSPLTCSWFMRCLRAREADGVFDVPGVKGGWGPEGEIGGGKLIVRVADEETKEWVERGRCHLKGMVDGWIEVVVGDDAESTVDGWPLV